MNTHKTVKILAAIALLAVCAIALIPSESADALPSKEVYRYYYYDAAHTQLAGVKWVTSCYGVVNIMLSGVETSNIDWVEIPCD